MPETTPVTLQPGTLPFECYPADPQELNVAIIAGARAFLAETFPGIYVGNTAPPVNQRNRLWFNTDTNWWYQWVNAGWMRPYQVAASSKEEIIWSGSEAELNVYDGGDAGALGIASGPLWQIDHDFDGRTLVGAGDIPGSSPVVTLNQGDTGGEYQHVLTGAEGAVADHVHAFGLSHAGNDDAYFNVTGVTTVVGYSGFYITGSNGSITAPQTTADLFTSQANAGAGVTSEGHNNMQPYRVRYVCKRTSRVWVSSPN